MPIRNQAGLLSRSDELTRSIWTALTSAGWTVLEIDHPCMVSAAHASCDLLVIAADGVTSAILEHLIGMPPALGVPTLVVTRDRDAQAIADVLRAGAGDYLAYPYAEEEFLARVESLVARSRFGMPVVSEQMAVDCSQRTITRGSDRVKFSNREWAVLVALLRQPGETLTVEELSLAHDGSLSGPAVVSIISRVRKRLRASSLQGITIETVGGRGYRADLGHDADQVIYTPWKAAYSTCPPR